jgi:hypothetical protein
VVVLANHLVAPRWSYRPPPHLVASRWAFMLVANPSMGLVH